MGIVTDSGMVELSENLKETVVLYAEMVKTLRRINGMIVEKKPFKHEELRFYKLESRIDGIFKLLSDDEQYMICRHLISEKLMPEDIGRALEVFSGRIAKSPCQIAKPGFEGGERC